MGARHIDWDRIDPVLRYMVPQGFSVKEVAEAIGIKPEQAQKRAFALGIPFSLAFGPQSRCRSGKHYLQKVGFVELGHGRRCKACYAEQIKSAGEKRRSRTGATKRPPLVKSVRSRDCSATEASYRSAMATNAILALHEEKECAATWWERERIQEQIEELQKRVTA